MKRPLSTVLPQALVFDMDGLIFDTERLWQKALLSLAKERGLDGIDQPVVDRTVGLSWRGIHDMLRETLREGVDVDGLIADWNARYDGMAATELALKPGVVELIDEAERLGVARAIATGAHRETATRHLESFGLQSRFAAIVCREDCPAGKPAPDPFEIAASRLEVDPGGCWALEDSPDGVRSAYDAGMQAIMVPDLLPPDEATREMCSAVATSLHDVIAWLGERAPA